MKPSAVLINSARGPIIDPQALYDALAGGQLRAAAVDVTEPEPINMDSPLLTLPNFLVAPHIASATIATRGKMAMMAAKNLIAGVNGERLPTPVNPEVYEQQVRR
jgi:glyoxylate reductase